MHFVTGNFQDRAKVFTDDRCCSTFLQELGDLNQKWPSKLIAYVLMPDHFHLISNPSDGRIREFIGALKSLSARRLVDLPSQFHFPEDADGHRVWQESFKALPLWSGWMIWQKINNIHANPVKAGLVNSARDYHWSSFKAFYHQGSSPLEVDHDWWWPDDAEKLSQATKKIGLQH